MLPAEIHAELSQLLLALQSPDNGTRSQAEDHLQANWTATRPDVLLMGLAEQISGSTDVSVRRFHPPIPWLPPSPHSAGRTANTDAHVLLPQLRSFAAVIFRRIASKTRKNDRGDTVEIFVSLGPEQASAIRQKLLECLTNEAERVVRNKISDAVADVARQYADNS